MTILELREKRNKAWEAAKAFVETKRDKDGLLSAEDATTYAEMEQKVQNYSAEIARMEEMGIELDSLKWYCDLRRFGSDPGTLPIRRKSRKIGCVFHRSG